MNFLLILSIVTPYHMKGVLIDHHLFLCVALQVGMLALAPIPMLITVLIIARVMIYHHLKVDAPPSSNKIQVPSHQPAVMVTLVAIPIVVLIQVATSHHQP